MVQPDDLPTRCSSESSATPSSRGLNGHFTGLTSDHLNASLPPSLPPFPSHHCPSSTSSPSLYSSSLHPILHTPLSSFPLPPPHLLLPFAPLLSSSQISLSQTSHSNTQPGLHATRDTCIASNHSPSPLFSPALLFPHLFLSFLSLPSLFLASLRFFTPDLRHVSGFQPSSPPVVPP